MTSQQYRLIMLLSGLVSAGVIAYLFITNQESRVLVSVMLVSILVVDGFVLKRMVR